MRHRIALAATFSVLLAGPVPARAGSSGGLVVRFSGCVRGDVTLTRSVSKQPPFKLTLGGEYAGWTLVQPDRETEDAIGGFLAPKFWPDPVRWAWPLRASVISAGRYRLSACADRPSTLRLTLPGYQRWVTVPTKPAGTAAQYAIAPLQTGSLEVGVGRKTLTVSHLTTIIVGYSRATGDGASRFRMCYAEVGQNCVWPPGPGLVLGADVFISPNRATGAMITYHYGPTAQTDAVVELVGSRMFDGQPGNMFFAAAIPH